MSYFTSHRRIIAGTIVLILFSIIPFILLTNKCSSSDTVDKKTTIDRSETTKHSEYNSYNQTRFLWSFFNPLSYEENSTEETSNTREEPSNWWNDFWCGAKFTDVVLADFTILLTFFTALLFISTEKLTKAARDEFNATHRPQLILRYAYSPSLEKGKIIEVKANITNIGNSPATIIASKLRIEFIGDPDILVIPVTIAGSVDDADDIVNNSRFTQEVEKEQKRIFIAQGASHEFLYPIKGEVVWDDNTMTPWLKTSPIGLFFSGKIIYEDTGGVWRRMAFRRKFARSRYFERIHDADSEHDYVD